MRAGQLVTLTGKIYTARDLAHKRVVDCGLDGLPEEFRGGAIYHCGPIIRKRGNTSQVIAAGPTTSNRMEETLQRFLKTVRPSAIIGKGGLSGKAVSAMVGLGCPYLSMTGGTAALASSMVVSAKGPFWNDLGSAEAVWELDVERFGPLVVAIDSTGKNLHDEVVSRARRRALGLFH
ncbi:MAG: FumA C-terminus/TtdB family hydratase beta subunit [Methanobacteriota archaeon]